MGFAIKVYNKSNKLKQTELSDLNSILEGNP